MFKRLKTHVYKWSKWRKRNAGSPLFKFLTLIGILKPPTFVYFIPDLDRVIAEGFEQGIKSTNTIFYKERNVQKMKITITARPTEVARLIKSIQTGSVEVGELLSSEFEQALREAEPLRPIGSAPIYGVSGLYNPIIELTRTDDAVGLNYKIDRETGEVVSDFNALFPWSETQLVTDEHGNEFVSFPRMYFRVGADSDHRLTDVAVSAEPSGSGEWYEVKPFMYGRYGGSVTDGRLQSTPMSRASCKTRDDFRQAARLNGDGYCQLDLYHRTVLMFLWYIEFATKRSADIMTGRIYQSGTEGGCSVCEAGGTDSVKTPSGYNPKTAQMRYHYIEDFIGNMLEFVDGVYCGSSDDEDKPDYVTDNPADFSDDLDGKAALCFPVPESGYLSALGWDDEHPFLVMPIETKSNGLNHFCTYADGDGGSRYPVLYCGSVYYYASANYGLSYFYRNSVSSSYDSLGGRLLRVS